MKKTWLFCFFLGLGNFSSFATNQGIQTFYGSNDVVDITSVKEQWILDATESVATQVRIDQLKKKKNQYLVMKQKLDLSHFDPTSKFADFMPAEVYGSCTAFLVTEDTLITARHCLRGQLGETPESICEKSAWVFTLTTEKEKKQGIIVESNQVAYCEELLEYSAGGYPYEQDYALIRIDQKRKPLQIVDSAKKTQVAAQLVMLGYPMGKPLMVSSNGKVGRFKGDYFFHNLDSFSGHSGAPIFDLKSHKVVGMHISGAGDFVEVGDESELVKLNVLENSKSQEIAVRLPVH